MGDALGTTPKTPKPLDLGTGLNQVFSSYNQQSLPAFNSYVNNQALPSGAKNAALGGLNSLPAYQSAYQSLIGSTAPLNTQLRGFQSQIPELTNQYADIIKQYSPIVQSGGAITDPGQLERLQQQSQAGFAARGNNYGNQSIGADLLNRSESEQQRLAQASGMVEGATQGQAGLLGLGGNLTGLQSGLIGQQAGLVGQEQNATAAAIQPALATQQSNTASFGGLVNPLLNYNQDINNTNFNAQAAAGINAANKNAGLVGGGIGAAGNIAGGYLAGG